MTDRAGRYRNIRASTEPPQARTGLDQFTETVCDSTRSRTFGYDTAGLTSYTYDNAGRLATLANPVTGTTATYSYNPESQVSGISYGSGKDARSFGYAACIG